VAGAAEGGEEVVVEEVGVGVARGEVAVSPGLLVVEAVVAGGVLRVHQEVEVGVEAAIFPVHRVEGEVAVVATFRGLPEETSRVRQAGGEGGAHRSCPPAEVEIWAVVGGFLPSGLPVVEILVVETGVRSAEEIVDRLAGVLPNYRRLVVGEGPPIGPAWVPGIGHRNFHLVQAEVSREV